MSQEWRDVHPQAAQHRPYLDEMAAWRNTVTAGIPSANFADVPQRTPPTADEAWEESLEVSGEPVEVTKFFDAYGSSPEGPPVTPAQPAHIKYERPFQTPEDLQEAAEEALSHPETDLALSEAPEPSQSLFDPSEHNAVQVLYHLKSAASTEIVRVMDLERQGKARKGILGQEEDLIAKARKREN